MQAEQGNFLKTKWHHAAIGITYFDLMHSQEDIGQVTSQSLVEPLSKCCHEHLKPII